MDQRFSKSGNLGRWMMRNTTSIQVNIDILNDEDANLCTFIADCINPLVAILFSNSPFMNGKPVGNNNVRYQIWNDTDSVRCGHLFEHNIKNHEQLLRKYVDYVLTVPVLFTTPDENGIISSFNGTIGQWLYERAHNGTINDLDFKTALHQIFTHSRFKQVLENRLSDRTLPGFELATAAFWMGIFESTNEQNALVQRLLKWSNIERNGLNQLANQLDLSAIGPENQPVSYWLNVIGNVAISGLEERAKRLQIKSESIYFTPFFESVLSLGPFSVQIQDRYKMSEKSVLDFLKQNIQLS